MSALPYLAFLRGINVGGNTIITMADLKKAFAGLGCTNITTVLASGNVVFDSAEKDTAALASRIKHMLLSKFGFDIDVAIRSGAEIRALVGAKPFKNHKLTPQTKLHVTFLPPDLPQGLKVSQRLNGPAYDIFRLSPGEVCCSVELSLKWGTSDVMKILEKQFGKKITTRTWKTIEKIAEVLG